MYLLDVIYKRSPVFLQNAICTAYGFFENRKRHSEKFYELLSFMRASDFYDDAQRLSYKKEKMTALLLELRRHPYYEDLLSEYDVASIVADPFSVLGGVPLMQKEVVLNNYELLSARKTDSYLVKTSGTTGSALKLRKTYNDMAAQTAAWFRHRGRFGVSFKEQSVNFTGKVVVDIKQRKPPYWRYNKAWNQYLVNMQSINDKNIHEIVSFLNSIKPKFYSGYPSIIGDLARLAMSKGLKLDRDASPRFVFCGAENTLAWQAEAITAWTGAKVTDLYGLTEGACNLSKCQYDLYHEDFEICHTELVDVECLSGGRVRGKLVGTGFHLEAFPLLRYVTGDIAVRMSEEYRCACGRAGPVYESIEGRIDDYVLTPSGSRIMRFDYLFKDTFEIKEVQVVQEVLDQVKFRIVLNDEGGRGSLENKIKERFGEWISSDMNLVFEYPRSIEKSASGKFKAVVGLAVGGV